MWRIWDETKPYALFICLNPSTADETDDDPTLRRCIEFARSWGYGGLCMGNLFAFRATQPKDLMKSSNPIGDDNDYWLKKLSKDAHVVIAGWGNHGVFLNRSEIVKKMLPNLYCLKKNKSGQPSHPLYLKKHSQLLVYELTDDQNNDLFELERLSNLSIEYVKNSVATEIFKPQGSEITTISEAKKYFRDSIYHYSYKNKNLFERIDFLRGKVEGSFRSFDTFWDALEFSGISSYDFDLEYEYAKKFSDLPLDYVYSSFSFNKERIDECEDPLTTFLLLFSDALDEDFDIFDFDKISQWYAEHKKN